VKKLKTYYDIGTEIDFGKYKGLMFEDSIMKDTDYFEWCIQNVDWFFVPPHIVDQFRPMCLEIQCIFGIIIDNEEYEKKTGRMEKKDKRYHVGQRNTKVHKGTKP